MLWTVRDDFLFLIPQPRSCSHSSALRGQEDWMPDSASHRWSYYAARMRSAIALSKHEHMVTIAIKV